MTTKLFCITRPRLAIVLAAVATLSGLARANDFVAERNRMVDDEIVAAGVKDPRVVQSMRDTPRHEFVPIASRVNAYYDMALPIGEGQTISPPFIVAYMTEQLLPQSSDTVLEIGTGSGYQAAVLSPLVKDVYTIEIVEALGERAARTLETAQVRQRARSRSATAIKAGPSMRRSTRSSSPARPRRCRQSSSNNCAKGAA